MAPLGTARVGSGAVSGTRLSARGRALLVTALAALTVLVAVAPRPLSSPIARLANYDADGPLPIYNVPIDDAALRRAGELLPDDVTYYIHSRDEPGFTVFDHDLRGAAYLYLLPALPVQKPEDAEWLLSYRAEDPPPFGGDVMLVAGEGVFLTRR